MRVKAHKVFQIPLLEKEYVQVIVANSPRQMRKIHGLIDRRCRLSGGGEKWVARCYQWTGQKRREEVALVLFCKQMIGGGIVAHEMYHATAHYRKRRRLSEEACALTIETLVRTFWEGWYSRKFKPQWVTSEKK